MQALPAEPENPGLNPGPQEKRPVLLVDEETAGRRLDNVLFSKLDRESHSRVYKAIRKGEVRVDGGRVEPSRKLSLGEAVRLPPDLFRLFSLRKQAPGTLDTRAQALLKTLSESVVRESPHHVILNKPSGLPVHGGSGKPYGLIDLWQTREPKAALVHRLDEATSGLILLAKSPQAAVSYTGLFAARAIEKTYLLLSLGTPQTRRFTANFSLPTPLGKPQEAETAFELLWQGEVGGVAVCLLRAFPKTGRKHQIRLHAQALGLPIVGDRRYGHFQINRQLGAEKLHLHAATLSFNDPHEGGVNVRSEAPLPKDWILDLTNLIDVEYNAQTPR